MSPDDRLTVDDVIRAGGCANGIRRWFTGNAERLPETMTLRAFLEEGMPLDVATSLGDPFIERALALKEADSGR
jgi:hypothetical protein